MNFEYAIWVPSLKKDIFAQEITTHQQKELIKAISNPYTFVFTRTLKKLLQENITSDINIDNLTLVDKLVILLKMRSQSISNLIQYSFKCDKCNKNIITKVPLISLVNQLNKISIPDIEIAHDMFSIVVGLPTIGSELVLEQDSYISADLRNNEIGDFFLRDLLIYIKSINFSKTNISVDLLDVKLRQQYIEKLPAKLLIEIREKIKTIKEQLDIVLLDVICLCGHNAVTIKLSVDNLGYIQFIKSIFDENLHNIYQQIYYMTNILHFTPEYVEKMIPGERDIYWGYYSRDERERQNKQNDQVDKLEKDPK